MTAFNHPLVGAWIVTFPAEPLKNLSLNSFSADGLVVQTNLQRPGQGVWAATGERTAVMTLAILGVEERDSAAPSASVPSSRSTPPAMATPVPSRPSESSSTVPPSASKARGSSRALASRSSRRRSPGSLRAISQFSGRDTAVSMS